GLVDVREAPATEPPDHAVVVDDLARVEEGRGHRHQRKRRPRPSAVPAARSSTLTTITLTLSGASRSSAVASSLSAASPGGALPAMSAISAPLTSLHSPSQQSTSVSPLARSRRLTSTWRRISAPRLRVS